ncbi:MAG: hypothetical protein J7K40_03235 [candidate division Zixibacteria bacterium]|nr:hypothetical protein [candidate division Zixibacteria bacterium]
MSAEIIKCTNCGKLNVREHLLPLCNDCHRGLEDYENFIAKIINDVYITIDKKIVKTDNFLRV